MKDDNQVPFFGVAREFAAFRPEIISRIEEVLKSGQVLQGRPISDLENRIASLVGRKYAVATNSCTDALYFALLAADIQAGDEVLVSDFSFIASASCISKLGAVPVFVDVDESYNMDLQKAAELISPKTRAMIFVHLYGQMSDPVQVESFAQAYGLFIIEDAAQAISAVFSERKAGSLGKVSCFSFDPTKPISAPGSGGLALTDDEAMANRIRRLIYHGKTSDEQFIEIGYNSQMPTLTAAVLDFKLDHDSEWLRRRRRIARYFGERLKDLDIILPKELPGSAHIYHKYVIRSPQRDAIKTYLAKNGVQTRIHYPHPLHQQPCFGNYGYSDVYYPNALRFSQTVLSLPIHPFLDDSEVETIVDVIRRFFITRKKL